MLRDDIRRPTLVGMNNPLSGDPEHALFPHPPGCTGHRIWSMLHDYRGVRRSEYTETFDRVNVLGDREWSASRARAAAAGMLQVLAGRQHVVLLGAAPVAALRVAPCLPGHWAQHRDPEMSAAVRYTCLPHPSGRCRWYNDHDNRQLARELLWQLYSEWQAVLATEAAAG